LVDELLVFVAGKGDEFFVVQVMVRNHDAVIGESDHTVATLFIIGLNFFGGHAAIGEGGMAMKICLVKLALRGNEILFHEISS
jgi:hypothetical protein